jgi:tRNA A37 threonylcarbamoyladenosine modification protein TsaB
MEYLYLDGSFENPILGTTSAPFLSTPKDLLFQELEMLMQNKFDMIALGSGPGSHTGTRAMASIAKGLCMGLQLPLKYFPSLLFKLPKAEGKIGTSILTRRAGLHYALLYDTKRCTVDFAGLLSQEELSAAIASLDAFGEAFSAYHLKSFLDVSAEISLSAPLSYLQL